MRICPPQREMSILEGLMKSRPMGSPSAGLPTTLNTILPARPQSASGAVTRSLLGSAPPLPNL